LVLENGPNDGRDHCSNELNFRSLPHLSAYLRIVSIAIVITFHLKHELREAEEILCLPLGIWFKMLRLACLFVGLGN
ncbi:hypothetical protein HOY82DRAFT_474524, partial [Tuber indicum]